MKQNKGNNKVILAPLHPHQIWNDKSTRNTLPHGQIPILPEVRHLSLGPTADPRVQRLKEKQEKERSVTV